MNGNYWGFGVLLKLNSISVPDCRKWVEAIYRTGANYCVLELGENTPDELIEGFVSSCRKYKMYVGLYSKSVEKSRIEHLLSRFGRIDYLKLDEKTEDMETLKESIFALSPDIYLRGPESLVSNASAETWSEYDYDMADIKPWHEEETVINSAENIFRICSSVMAEGMNCLLHVSVIRTRNHYEAQLQCLNDLGQKLAPSRQKLKVSKRSWLVAAAAVILIFCASRVLYVNKVYGQYQKKLVGYRSRTVTASVGKYGYSVMMPRFPHFRGGPGGLYYATNGPLRKVNGDSINIYVKVTPYLKKPADYEVYVSVIQNVAEENLPDGGRKSCVLILDNELNPAPKTDAEALAIYKEYYEYIYEQIRVGNEYFGIEYGIDEME